MSEGDEFIEVWEALTGSFHRQVGDWIEMAIDLEKLGTDLLCSDIREARIAILCSTICSLLYDADNS